MKIASVFSVVALFASGALLLSGCASSPLSRFYTLTPEAPRSGSAAGVNMPSVAIVSVTLPELVDRPQLVVRSGDSRVELLETHRWAEPLKSAISRIMAEDLSRLLVSDRVWSYPQAASLSADCRVSIDVRLFEFTKGHAELDVSWALRRADDRPVVGGRSRRREAAAGDYDAVVAAFSRGLAGVSQDIALELKNHWLAGQ